MNLEISVISDIVNHFSVNMKASMGPTWAKPTIDPQSHHRLTHLSRPNIIQIDWNHYEWRFDDMWVKVNHRHRQSFIIWSALDFSVKPQHKLTFKLDMWSLHIQVDLILLVDAWSWSLDANVCVESESLAPDNHGINASKRCTASDGWFWDLTLFFHFPIQIPLWF